MVDIYQAMKQWGNYPLTTYTDTEVNICFSKYHTDTKKLVYWFLLKYQKMVRNQTLDRWIVLAIQFQTKQSLYVKEHS